MKNLRKFNKNYKSHYLILFLLVLIGLGQSMSLWADELKVEEKIVLDASSKAVWALVGGFNALDRWHPDIMESALMGTGKDAGDIRVLTLNNNLTIVERLEFYDENSMILQYRILESPLPIENYLASITVKNIDNNMAEVTWQSSFNAVDVSEDEVKQTISSIYLAGLDSLYRIFK